MGTIPPGLAAYEAKKKAGQTNAPTPSTSASPQSAPGLMPGQTTMQTGTQPNTSAKPAKGKIPPGLAKYEAAHKKGAKPTVSDPQKAKRDALNRAASKK